MGRPGLLALVFLVLVGGGTAWLLAGGDKGVAIATVLALTVAVLLGAAQLFGVTWQPPDPAKLAVEARKLAREVRKRERAEQNLFLADSAEGKPADIGFVPPEQLSWRVELVVWRSEGGEQSGSLADIAGFYATHAAEGSGRLVVLGRAGAGKTVLANQLLLDLTARLLALDSPPDAQLRVPVRLSLPAFDPGVDEGDVGSGIVASRLDAWIADQLMDVFGLRRRVATALVTDGWVLPILDGLDEMDADGSDAIRAAATMRALNYSARPVVVTCRNDRYKQLAAAPAQPGQERVLQDVTVIELQPLTPKQVATYLVRRFPDPADRAKVQLRWQPVLNNVESGGPLAVALGSPLRLFMAVITYYQPKSSPAKLCKRSAKAIDKHLFENFIPAVTRQHTKPDGGYYDPIDVERWLRSLARHLERQQKEGGSRSDLDLSTLWTAAGEAPRRWAAALQLLLTGLPALVAAGIYISTTGHLIAPDPSSRAAIAAWACIVAFSTWRANRPQVQLIRFDLSQLRNPNARREVAAGVIIGLASGIALGTGIWLFNFGWRELAAGFQEMLGTALAGGLVGGVTWRGGLSGLPAAVGRPRELVSQGLAHDVAIPLTFGLAGALAYGLAPTLLGLRGVLSSSAFGFALVRQSPLGV